MDAGGEAHLLVFPGTFSSHIKTQGGHKDVGRGLPVALGLPLLMTWGATRIRPRRSGLLREAVRQPDCVHRRKRSKLLIDCFFASSVLQ